jgi:hypothetical protein
LQPVRRVEQPQVVLLLQHLLARSTQAGHDAAAQAQLPLWHTRLFVQACDEPHPPQLLLSVCSLTHAPLHAV